MARMAGTLNANGERGCLFQEIISLVVLLLEHNYAVIIPCLAGCLFYGEQF